MANGTGDGKTESNGGVIKIVVVALAVDAAIGVGSLGWCLVTGVKPDATLLTAFVGLTSALVGYLGGILSRTTPTASTAAESKPTGTVTVPEQQLETAKT